MMKNFEEYKHALGLFVVGIVAIVITFAHHGGLIIDCGREVYYPSRILDGAVLYKDLFNIYGPFSYLFNALLYKVFAVNLNTLYIAGSTCALMIVFTVYYLAKRFLSDSISFYIGLFTIAVGVLNLNLFNFVFPYSYGILYGLLGFLLSVLFLIKYTDTKNSWNLYVSLFFAGFCIANKYEFTPYLIVVLFTLIRMKSSVKEWIIGLGAFLSIPLACFTYLFLKGLTFSDLLNTAYILQGMTKTKTLKYFYMHNGVFFHKWTVLMWLKNIALMGVPLFIYTVPVIFKDKFTSQSVNLLFFYTGLILLILMKVPENAECLTFLPVLITVLAIVLYKEIKKDFALFVLVASAILFSIKVFFGLIYVSYGVFYVSMLVITLFALISTKLNKKHMEYVGFYILVFAILTGMNNLKSIFDKQYKLETPRGTIYTTQTYYKSTKKLLEFLETKTEKSDTVTIYPEGMLVNFLADRKVGTRYNSLIPLYAELFADSIVEDFVNNKKPEYVIFNNYNTRDYYFSYICKDYAFEICDFVLTNYSLKDALRDDFEYLIFEEK